MVAGPASLMNTSRIHPSVSPAEGDSASLTGLLHAQAQAQRLVQRADDDDNPSAASFYLPTLPGLDPQSSLKMFAGHLPSTPPSDPESDSHLFFFLVLNAEEMCRDRERLVIWVNGGPGCSSFDGALMELNHTHPSVRLTPGEKKGDRPSLKEVEGAWNEYSNVLFIDQPAGTGYSYVSTNHYVHDLPVAADHIVEFLHKFYKVFPEFESMHTYIAGESYAGQYIPYMADAILKADNIKTSLQGLVIGNGWFDPWAQYPAYLPFAYQANVLKKDSQAAKKVEEAHDACKKVMDRIGKPNLPVHEDTCEDILNVILDSTIETVNGQKLCINTYDVRLTDKYPACGMNWPPDLSMLYDYLPLESVKDAFHASRKEGGWVECSGQVGGHFTAKASKPSVTLLPELLESIPILLFAGDQDLICNWLGISNMIDDLKWNGETGFGSEEALPWFVDGQQAGTWQTARNLSFVKVADASHMVPFDVPFNSHDMLLRFQGTDFLSAAGSAAKVPSRVGAQQDAVVGQTVKNGSLVMTSNGVPVTSGDSAGHREVPAEASSTAAYYNLGSALLVILLLGVVGMIFYTLRKKVRQSQFATADLGRYEAAYSDPGTPSGSEKGRRVTHHKRGMGSLSKGSSTHQGARSSQEALELERLVQRGDLEHGGGDRKTSVAQEEDVFSLGDSDEDRDGGGPRQRDSS